MKTSTQQFEMMVSYMEQHGDLNKPSKNPRGRIQAIKHWEKLTHKLNSGPTGDKKSTEKWKKVWSDLKNNTKKKAARISKAATGTGGGSALQLKLSELEQRVIDLIGYHAPTGCESVTEAGLAQDRNGTLTVTPSPPAPVLPNSPLLFIEAVEEESPVINIDRHNIQNSPEASRQPSRRHISTPPLSPVQSPPVQSSPIPSPPLSVLSHSSALQEFPRNATFSEAVRPAQRGLTPRLRGSTQRPIGSPRRPIRPQSHVDQATAHFLQSDEQWRTFIAKKHEDECSIERERIRIREIELQVQQKWQEITKHALDALHKIIDAKLCND